MANANDEGRVYEVWFRGVHSDVGGGNGNNGLSSIALNWMYKRCAGCGIAIPAAEIQRRQGQINPSAPVSEDLDPQKDPYRPIPWTDVVHQSVSVRDRAHNPPKGLKVMDDDGRILAKGFGE
jgi:uncharacterized protein (DUF2235 family)